jgi:sulfonate transport system ATP-binding protein
MSVTAPTAVAARPALPVSIRDVGRTFRSNGADHPVLRGVDLDIATGEIVALLGTSGSGKSTLLRQVCGLDTPDTGDIRIDGTAVDGVDPRCAVAFQEPRLLPWRTLAHNVSLGLPRGTDRAAGRQRVQELLDLVGLQGFHDHRPRQISGGMAQRCSLARALARSPGVLLLDEPFGALDALTRLRMQDLLLDVHAVEPATVLLVTHDVDEALYLADRVVLLGPSQAGPGNGIATIVDVPGERPRDRADADLAELRVTLLEGLGVPRHHDDPTVAPAADHHRTTDPRTTARSHR